jgi:hypothetical protein
VVAVRLNETMVKWLDGFGSLDGVWVMVILEFGFGFSVLWLENGDEGSHGLKFW